MADMLTDFFSQAELILNRGLDNPYINITIKVLIGLYAALAAPKLPKSLSSLTDNMFVRVIFAFIIVYLAVRDPSIAILVAVAFIVTLQTANKLRLYNTNLSVSQPYQTSWLPSSKDEDIYEEEGENGSLYEIGKPVTNLVTNMVDTAGNLVKNTALTGHEFVNDVAHTGTKFVSNVADVGENIFSVNEKATEDANVPSNNLNKTVEELTGILPQSLKNIGGIYGEEIDDKEPEPKIKEITSPEQFESTQSNHVPNTNQYSCVKSWSNQNCIQGLEDNHPNGSSKLEYADF